MKNILIPTDFSEEQKNTVKYGIQLAQFYKSKITLVSTIAPPHTSSAYMASAHLGGAMPVKTDELQEVQHESTEESFEVLVKELKEQFDRIPQIDTRIEIGLNYQVISDLVENEDIDLVLLTGYEGDGFLEYLADDRMDIVEEINIPVMFVPVHNTSFKEFKRVVYATDYKKEDILSMHHLVNLVKPFFGFIYGIHVSKELDFDEMVKEEGFEAMLSEKIGYSNLNVYSISQESVTDGILKFAKEADADLISVLKEDKGFFKRIFNDDKTKKITRKSNLAVLVFNE